MNNKEVFVKSATWTLKSVLYKVKLACLTRKMVQGIVSDAAILGEVKRGEWGEILDVLHPYICDRPSTQLQCLQLLEICFPVHNPKNGCH